MGSSSPSKPSQPTAPSRALLSAVLSLCIALAAFAPFFPALTAGFVAFDDPGILKDVDGYRGLGPTNLRWMFTTTHMGHYQPLTWVSYAFDHLIWGKGSEADWGLNSFGFHLTNMLLHAANAALVFLLARRLLAAALARDERPRLAVVPRSLHLDLAAAGAALLFAVHPLRVESVAWVTERRDVLSSFFLLLAALAYLRAFPPRAIAAVSKAWYIVSIALLLLSLLSKAWGMTFFVILIVLDWYPLRRLPDDLKSWLRPPNTRVLLQKLPYLALGLAALVMAGHATGSIRFTVVSLQQWGIGARLAQAMFGLMFYVQKTVWPMGLAALYELPRVFDPWEPRFLAAYVFTGTVAITAWRMRRRFPAFTAAAIAYAVILGPVLGFRQSGPQIVADRYSYLANISWALLAGGAVLLWVRRPKAALPALAAAVAVLATLAAITWHQTGFWRGSEVLFKRAIDAGSDGPIIREFYGRQLSERGLKDAALYQFQKGIELDPGYAECWFSEANTLKDLGRFPEAERSYMQARKLMADSWRASMMQGMMYITIADRVKEDPAAAAQAIKGAEACFRAAISNVESIRYEPVPGRPYLMLAAALDMQGDAPGTRRMLEKAALCPDTREEALQHLRDIYKPDTK